MNIPGFFYDPISKRYFREPKEWDHVKLKPNVKEADGKPPDISSVRRPQPKEILGLLRNREIGMRKNVDFESPFLKLKTKFDFGMGEDLSLSSDENIHDIIMIKAGKESLFGLWKIKDSWEDVVNEVFLDPSNNDLQSKFGKVKASGITDFCNGFHNSDLLLVVSNDYSTQTGRVLLLRRHEHESLENEENVHVDPVRFYSKASSIFCCSSNSWVRKFAIGVEHFVEIDNVFGTLGKKSAIGNVHALHFNDKGTLLYCGIHTGVLSIMDMREDTSCADKKLFDAGINEITLLSNQLELICGSFDGDLGLFDLRMQKIAVKYFDHVHSTKRSPISLNESLNLLCATGVDNLTRLWSLSGTGAPIRVIRPPEEFQPHRAWLSNDSWNPKVYIFQNKLKYTCNV